MEQSVSAVEQIIGYSFQNKKLLEEALTHSSYTESPSYQRLEFFGDAALGLAVSNYIFHAYPRLQSGPLTLLRSANVSNEKLARVAVRHGLFLHLRHKAPDLQEQVRKFTEAVAGESYKTPLVYGGSVKAPKVLADIVESVASAVYVDLNFDLEKLWMNFRHLLEPIVTLEQVQPHVDIKQRRDGTKSIASVYVDGEFVASASSKLDAAKRSFEVIVGIDGSVLLFDIGFFCCSIEKDEGPSHEKRFASNCEQIRVLSSLSADQINKKKESEATMEGLTEGVNNLQITTDSSNKRNRIQVSNTKKPLFFYINLAKRYMQQNNEVELSALGMAMSTVVTIAEILKNSGLAFEKRISTSTVDMRKDAGGRPIQKAKIEILLGKSDKFDEIMAAEEDIVYEEQS